jgi:Domain of unknown function (DUF5666)
VAGDLRHSTFTPAVEIVARYAAHRGVMRYAIVVLTSLTALSVAACGSSSNPSPAASKSSVSSPTSSTSAPSTAAPQASNGKDHIAGLIASVSGNTVQVNQRNGSATVDVGSSTKVAELTPAQLTDLTPGSCVTARSPRDNPSGAARMIVIGNGANGQCTAPNNARAGMVRGSVASVNGNTVVVNVTAQNGSTSASNVAVDTTTTYLKRASATSSAIAQGKCLAARGTNDSSGTLQATSVTVSPANNGNCPGARR